MVLEQAATGMRYGDLIKVEPTDEQDLEALDDVGRMKRQRVLAEEFYTSSTRDEQQQEFHQGMEGTVFPAEMAMDAHYMTATAPTQVAFANSTPGQCPICFNLKISGISRVFGGSS